MPNWCSPSDPQVISKFGEEMLIFEFSVPHHHEDDDSIEEPPFQYTPAEEGKNLDGLDSSGERAKSSEPLVSPLDISMNLLQEGLESDSLFIQFQVSFPLFSIYFNPLFRV